MRIQGNTSARRRVAALVAAVAMALAMTVIPRTSMVAEAACGSGGYAFDAGLQGISNLVAANTTIDAPVTTSQLACQSAGSFLSQWVMIAQAGSPSGTGYVQAGWDIEPYTNYQYWPFAEASRTNNGTDYQYWIHAPVVSNATFSAHNYVGYCAGFYGHWAQAGYDPSGTWQQIMPYGSCPPMDWTGGELEESEESTNTANYWGDYHAATYNWAEAVCSNGSLSDCNPTTSANVTTLYITPGWNACGVLSTPTEQQMWDKRQAGC